MTDDPLLPGRILPADYLGQQAWQRPVYLLRSAHRHFRTFKLEQLLYKHLLHMQQSFVI